MAKRRAPKRPDTKQEKQKQRRSRQSEIKAAGEKGKKALSEEKSPEQRLRALSQEELLELVRTASDDINTLALYHLCYDEFEIKGFDKREGALVLAALIIGAGAETEEQEQQAAYVLSTFGNEHLQRFIDTMQKGGVTRPELGDDANIIFLSKYLH